MDAVTATQTADILTKLPGMISNIAGAGTPGLISIGVLIVCAIIGLIYFKKAKNHAKMVEEQTAQNQDQAANAGQSSTLDQNAAQAENEIDNILGE